MMSQTKDDIVQEEISSCSKCPMVKTCAVYISSLEAIKLIENRFVTELKILDKVTWKAEDLANGCKYKPKRMEFGI